MDTPWGAQRESRYLLRSGSARISAAIARCCPPPSGRSHWGRTLNASARRFAFVAWQCSRRIYHALAVFTKAIGDGALERRGRGIGDLGLAGLHGHWRANSSVRTSKRHIRRVITAGDVVVARGAIIAVEDAAGESRICAIVDVHRSTSLRYEMEEKAGKFLVLALIHVPNPHHSR